MQTNTIDEPVNLNWANVCSESGAILSIQLREYPGTTDLWHVHKGFGEIILVLGGRAYNDVSEGHERLSAGDIQVYPPNSIHRYSSIQGFRHYTVLFQEEFLSQIPKVFWSLPNFSTLFALNGRPSSILHVDDSDLSKVVGLLEEIRTEYLSHSIGWEGAIYANFYSALVFISRHAVAAGQSGGNATYKIGRAIREMEDNPFREYTIRSLCAFAQMSESSFRHHFQALTNLSPIDFLIRLRLQRAALLIAHTDKTITEIALETGFSDCSYFARQFRFFFNTTARDFRMGCRAGTVDLTTALKTLKLIDN